MTIERPLVPVCRQRLTVEAYGCKGIDFENIYNFFDALTDRLGMNTLVPPVLVRMPVVRPVKNLNPEDYGISGHLIWAESGAQIHTWGQYRFVALDVFSCRFYGERDVVEVVRSFFSPDCIETGVPAVGVNGVIFYND